MTLCEVENSLALAVIPLVLGVSRELRPVGFWNVAILCSHRGDRARHDGEKNGRQEEGEGLSADGSDGVRRPLQSASDEHYA